MAGDSGSPDPVSVLRSAPKRLSQSCCKPRPRKPNVVAGSAGLIAGAAALSVRKGGRLHGTSAPRLAFLKKIMEEGPTPGLDPIQHWWNYHIGGKPFTREESWARLLRYGGLWSLLGYGYWAVRDKESGRFAGELGFAGFRLHENREGGLDWRRNDWAAFLGASYFRAIGELYQYGLSARGLAVDVAVFQLFFRGVSDASHGHVEGELLSG